MQFEINNLDSFSNSDTMGCLPFVVVDDINRWHYKRFEFIGCIWTIRDMTVLEFFKYCIGKVLNGNKRK